MFHKAVPSEHLAYANRGFNFRSGAWLVSDQPHLVQDSMFTTDKLTDKIVKRIAKD